MKTLSTIIITILLFSVIFLFGCSSEIEKGFQNKPRWDNPPGIPKDRYGQLNRSMNLTDEKMQQRLEEMQQQAVESCQDKEEGDACQLQGPMGVNDGKCSFRDEKLICAMDMPDRHMGQR